ncbi:MAG: hypothetical protein HUK03_08435 [Bacteroidaceae bacterium]|nr:hypothetical protein [Bacteroidaceae bacterium]
MEIPEIKTIKVLESRSDAVCMQAGAKVATDNLWQLMRYLSPSILVTVVCPLAYFLMAAQLDAIFLKWRELDYLPRVKATTLRSLFVQRLPRALVVYVLQLLHVVMMVAVLWAGVRFSHSLWWGAAGVAMVWLLCLPCDAFLMALSYDDKPIRTCSSAYINGWRNYGSLFAFHLVTGLIIMLVLTLFSLPLITLLLASNAAGQSIAMGDTVQLPGYIPILMGVAYIIAMLALLSICIIRRCMHHLLWGSMKAEEQENNKSELSDN